MNVRLHVLVWVLVLLPALVRGQTLNGVAEWTVANGAYTSDDHTSENNSFWQRYTIGFDAPLLDRRLMTYSAELSFRTTSLASGATENLQQGRQRDQGYKLGATLFPARAFPFFIQASRDTIGESGDYPASSGIRGGIVIPAGTPLPDFHTRNETLNMGWQLNLEKLPRVELGYRSGKSAVTGGPYEAEQRDDNLHAGVFKEGGRTRQALRYDRTSFENLISTSFNQRLNDLDYEFGAMLGARSRFILHSGRRSTFSLFDVAPQIVELGLGAYQPPSRGDINTVYLTSGIAVEPASRLSLDFTGNFDQQDSGPVTTSAKLAIAQARLEAVPGLSLRASGTYGNRGQVLDNVAVSVITQSALVGSAYRAGVRGLEGSVEYTRGLGVNTLPDGRMGEIRSWSGQASLSSSFRWITLSAGYERLNGQDEILDFGNYDSRRRRASAQLQVGRGSLIGSWEDAVVDRGRDATFASSWQRTFTESASWRFIRDSLLTASAGGFEYQGGPGHDRTLFYGGACESSLRALHLTAWLRREEVEASETRLSQASLFWFGELQYRLRTLSIALAYRKNHQDLRYERLTNPFLFRGHQLYVRISRTFGLGW